MNCYVRDIPVGVCPLSARYILIKRLIKTCFFFLISSSSEDYRNVWCLYDECLIHCSTCYVVPVNHLEEESFVFIKLAETTRNMGRRFKSSPYEPPSLAIIIRFMILSSIRQEGEERFYKTKKGPNLDEKSALAT